MTMAMLDLLVRRRTVAAGLVHGLSVHFRSAGLRVHAPNVRRNSLRYARQEIQRIVWEPPGLTLCPPAMRYAMGPEGRP
jgi:hypothetical protein